MLVPVFSSLIHSINSCHFAHFIFCEIEVLGDAIETNKTLHTETSRNILLECHSWDDPVALEKVVFFNK